MASEHQPESFVQPIGTAAQQADHADFQVAGLGRRYVSPRRRAQWAIAVLGLVAAIYGLSIVTDYSRRDLLQRIRDGERVTIQEAQKSDDRESLMGIIQTGAILVSVMTFLAWFYLVYRNLYAFGVEGLKYSLRWTWLGFVIPIMYLFRPYQVAAEIWKASDPLPNPRSSYQWINDDVGDVVKWWWGSFLTSNTIAGFVWRSYRDNATIDQMLKSNTWSFISDGGMVVAVVLAMIFVWSLTVRQESRVAAAATAPAAEPLADSRV